MVMVELKGLHRVRAKGRTYWYAWRGGPRLDGEPGTPAFVGSYTEALASRVAVDGDRVHAAIACYRDSGPYRALAPSTRRQWSRWLDIVDRHFGALRTAQFGRPEKIRPLIRKWRNTYADRPRAADYGMQVLSRVCAHMVDPMGVIASNPCEGIAKLYSADRSDIIWTDAEIAAVKAAGTAELGHAFDLAAQTGLRMSDLVRLSWSHVGDNAIVIATGKGRRKKRQAIVPLHGALRDLLATIPRRATTVLTSSKKRPWTANGLGSSIQQAKADAGLAEADLHFHDLRGTAATKFYLAGLKVRVIAEILAWEEGQVERIIRRYVGRNAATLEAIRQIDAAKAGT